MLEPLFPVLHGAGIALSPVQQEMLAHYARLLYAWNTRMNLTNVPQEDAWRTHFADALLPLTHTELFPQGARLIDVGTGAGLPGLPLAIARPDMQVVLLDALKKRCTFLTEVCTTLNLPNVTVMHARAEDAAHGALRAGCDLAVARAVAQLRVLAEYLLPFARVGGRVLCWKGPAAKDEADQAQNAIRTLGGQLERIVPIPVPDTEHQLVVIQKRRPTPGTYPRTAGTPVKKPL
ncbi:MAG TPA: 16S rRNA (guanine(527)-N(7))-methyltransferase RsmG [Clostridiales bacterium]|nr:16S rRNA (guanine(527)-N(7))-methyltransferase RsmG [Clostridiales bacterium]